MTLGFRSTKRRRGPVPASSKSRAVSRQSKGRQDRVSAARVQTITRIAKKAILSTNETKYTQFHQMSTAAYGIPRGDEMLCLRLTDAAAIFPAQGDNVHQRDGVKYKLLGFNVYFALLTDRNNVNSPLHVRVAAVHPRSNVRWQNLTVGGKTGYEDNGPGEIQYYYPQCSTTDAVTWTAGIPIPVGKFDANVGRIVKSFIVRPDTRVMAGNNLVHMATPTDVYNAIEYKYHKIFIPYKRTITTAGGSAEIPHMLPKFCLLLHCPQQNTTAWDTQYVYTQAVYKDM